ASASSSRATAIRQPAGTGELASTQPERQSPTQAYGDADVPLRNLPHASPSVRKFARELGVNLGMVNGTGRKNRISQDDVRQFVKQALATDGASAGSSSVSGQGGLSVAAWPKVDFAKF